MGGAKKREEVAILAGRRGNNARGRKPHLGHPGSRSRTSPPCHRQQIVVGSSTAWGRQPLLDETKTALISAAGWRENHDQPSPWRSTVTAAAGANVTTSGRTAAG
jgi:hypothetical protein